MSEARAGVIAMIAACVIWGLSPLLYAQVRDVPPLEVLSYRTLWSMVFFGGLILIRGQAVLVREAVTRPKELAFIAIAAVVISSNWFGFIYAISTHRGLEASLGYFVFPLFAVVVGRLVFGEQLKGAQIAAVALAAFAVIILTIGLGLPPWIAIFLAGSFAAYSALKKVLSMRPMVSVFLEVLLLAPLAAAYLLAFGTRGFSSSDIGAQAWLLLSGPATALPLMLMSYASKRITLATLGILQYINPTLQFTCAVFIFHEALSVYHMIAFPIIWCALAIYSFVSFRADRMPARRRDST